MSDLARQKLEQAFLAVFGLLSDLYRPLRHWIGAAILCLFVCMTVVVTLVYPASNWDMLAYTAVVLESEIDDPADLHRQSYELVQKNVTDSEYLLLTRDRPYRIHQAQTPESFATMLDFYRVKFLYVETARLLSQFLDPVVALRLISIVSSLAVGGLLLIWLARTQTLMYGPIIVSLLVLSCYGYTTQLLTPDMYASVFLILAAMLYIDRLDIPACMSLAVAFLIRPDHLAFIGVFFVFAVLYGPGRWAITGCFAACFAVYFWLCQSSGHPGWWVQLWFGHVEFVSTLKGFDPPFSVFIYLQTLVRATVRSMMNQTWLVLLFFQVLFFVKFIHKGNIPVREKALLYAVFASICAKYVVIPNWDTRFYLPYLVIMGMILLLAWHRQLSGDEPIAQQNPT